VTDKNFPILRIVPTGNMPIANHIKLYLDDVEINHFVRGLDLHIGIDEATTVGLEILAKVKIEDLPVVIQADHAKLNMSIEAFHEIKELIDHIDNEASIYAVKIIDNILKKIEGAE